MKRSQVVWSRETAGNAVVAHIKDADGREWTATIQEEPYRFGSRLVATLACPSAGRILSTNTQSSLEEAQEWCYRMLQLG
jgi:hypothetical protein